VPWKAPSPFYVSAYLSYAWKNRVTISPGELLSEAAKQMIDNRIGGLPVLDTNDQMVGILTETDLLRALIDQLGKETPQVFWALPRQPRLHRLTYLF
jgi:signal-transduction protein with cAMP-binding, CBS, and nucleotidyltransferase domain